MIALYDGRIPRLEEALVPRRKMMRDFVRALRLVQATDGRQHAHQLVEGLNAAAAEPELEGDQAEAAAARSRDDKGWRDIAEILLTRAPGRLGQLSESACGCFNVLAGASPATFLLGGAYDEDMHGGRIHRDVAGLAFTSPAGYACYLLWKIREEEALDRVKRCPQCQRWFVDETRNKSAARCSAGCTARWWDRSRRRAARAKSRDKRMPRRRRA